VNLCLDFNCWYIECWRSHRITVQYYLENIGWRLSFLNPCIDFF
jgi:hypothetical protein